MPEIEIRPMISADYQALIHLEHDNQTDYVWQMDRMIDVGQASVNFREIRLPRSIRIDYPKSAEERAMRLSTPNGVLVAVYQGEPVGYLRIDEQKIPRTAWITDLAVAAQQRRQGIATALIIAAQSWAIQRGLKKMILEMHSKNFPAIHLATKLGFDFSGYHDLYYSNQDIALFFSQLLR